MIARLLPLLLLLLLTCAALSCNKPGQDTEAGVTQGGEARRAEVEAEALAIIAEIRPGATDQIMIEAGARQYKRKCQFCHGVDGMKKIPLAVEAEHRVGKFAPDDIAVQVHSGVNIHGKVRNHKLFPTLKGAELYATILYVQHFFLVGEPSDPFAPWKARVAEGEALFEQHCVSCHGPELDQQVANLGGSTEVPAEAMPEAPVPATDPPAAGTRSGETPPTPGPIFDREYLLSHSPLSITEGVADTAKHTDPAVAGLSEQDRWTIAYFLMSGLYELP